MSAYDYFKSLENQEWHKISDIPESCFHTFWNDYIEKPCIILSKENSNLFMVVSNVIINAVIV